MPARRKLAGAMKTSAAVASWETARWRCTLLFDYLGFFSRWCLRSRRTSAQETAPISVR